MACLGSPCTQRQGASLHDFIALPAISFLVMRVFFPSVVGWMVVPPVPPYICSCPDPHTLWVVSSFGKKVFADVTRDLEVRSSWIPRWALNPIIYVLVRDRRGKDTDPQRGSPHEDQGRDRMMNLQARRTPGTTRRSWKMQITDTPRELSEGVWPCQHLDFRLPSRTVRE